MSGNKLPPQGLSNFYQHKRAKSSYGKQTKHFMQDNNLFKPPGLDTVNADDLTPVEANKRAHMYTNLIQKRPRQIDEEVNNQMNGSRPPTGQQQQLMQVLRHELLMQSPPQRVTSGNPLRSKSVNMKISQKYLKVQ